MKWVEAHPGQLHLAPLRARGACSRSLKAFSQALQGTEDIPITSMPGVSRVGVDTGLLREVEEVGPSLLTASQEALDIIVF